jgi:hypothetical protein
MARISSWDRGPLRTGLAALLSIAGVTLTSPHLLRAQADDPSPPSQRVKLIFIHHSCGENWLADGHGKLGEALARNN